MKLMRMSFWLTAGIVLAGCSNPVPVTVPPPATPNQNAHFTPQADAGVKRDPIADSSSVMVASNVSVRPDPFALTSAERAFDRRMLGENLGQTGWENMYKAPEEKLEPISVEPQPYRRLAGVLIGDTITALIDMGDGSGLQEIHPGSKIGQWQVVSIDAEHAVLRRIGSNQKPTEVVVNLETAPAGAGDNSGGTGGNPSGGTTGGAPTTGATGSTGGRAGGAG